MLSPLKLGIIGITLMGGSLLVSGVTQLEDANDGPARIEVEETRYDFGVVRPDSTVVARFPLRNTGGRRLIVTETSRGCGCLASSVAETIIPPGRGMELEVRLDCRGLRGRVSRQIEYLTNDPETRSLTLTLIADIES